MHYSIEQLEALIEAAETGSFSQAARELGKAQSTISSLINNLEIDIGQSLFHRSGRSTKLTRAGRELIKEARSVMLAYELFQNRCDSINRDVETSISIALDASALPRDQVDPILLAFGKEFPLTRLVFLDTGHTGAFELVGAGKAAIGVCHSLDSYPFDINYCGIANSSFVTVASTDHPLADLDSVTPEDLARNRHLRITSRGILHKREDDEISQEVWYADSYRTIIDMTRGGLGWADLPLHMVAEHVEAGTLKRLPTEHQKLPYEHPIDLIWTRSVRLGTAAEWLLDAFSNIKDQQGHKGAMANS